MSPDLKLVMKCRPNPRPSQAITPPGPARRGAVGPRLDTPRGLRYKGGAPGWRNWQTRETQNLVGFGPWGFDPPARHHPKSSPAGVPFGRRRGDK